MQTACWEMPWFGALRMAALVLAVVLGLEWTVPLGGYAQPNQEPTSTPVASMENQELPPMQEAEVIEERKPWYKKWWVWALAAAVVGGAAIAMAGGGGGDGTPAPTGDVTVTGPPPP